MPNQTITLNMPDAGSLAQNRGRRVIKPKKFNDEYHSSQKPDTNSSKTAKSQLVTSGTKRKQVTESRDNGRAARSKTKIEAKDQIESKSSSEVSQEDSEKQTNGSKDKTMTFMDALKNKTTLYHGSSMEGKSANLKITTWNINGIRAWLTKQGGLKFMRNDNADIFCFQEIKCGNSKVPYEIKNFPGYKCYYNGSDNGRSGVVCLTKKTPIKVTYGIGIEIYDDEARVITMEFESHYIVNVYVPNSGQGLKRLDFRMKWDADFLSYLKDLDSKKPVIVCGDMNVSHHEIDLANPKTNLKTAGFTIGERNNFTKLLGENQLVDIFRHLNPGKPACYTYWSYMKNAREKNIGWRLDYFLLSQRWIEKTCDVIIQSEVLGSDHCPVTIYLAI